MIQFTLLDLVDRQLDLENPCFEGIPLFWEVGQILTTTMMITPISPDIFNPHPGCCPDAQAAHPDAAQAHPEIAQAQGKFLNPHPGLQKEDFHCPIFSSMENAGKNRKICDPDPNKKLFMLQQKSKSNNNNFKILLWRLQSLLQDLRISEPKVKIQGRPSRL